MANIRMIYAAGAFVILGFLLFFGAHAVCQHRADYPRGLTLVGRPIDVFGTEYYRLYMWRAATDQSPLPDARLYVNGAAHDFDTLSPEQLASLTGTAPQSQGGVVDAAGVWVQYRFENGRMTWFSMDGPTPGSKANGPATDLRFAVGIGKSRAFTFPIRHGALIAVAGKPDRSYLHFAQ